MEMEKTQLTLPLRGRLLQARNVVGPGLVVPEPEVLARLIPGTLSGRHVLEVVLLSGLVRRTVVLAEEASAQFK
jgi:hypothetical protein